MKITTISSCLALAAACFLVGSSVSIAQTNLPPCPSSQSVKWTNCFGTYLFSKGDKYVGEFRDNKMHGQGTRTFPSGHKYVGEFKDNKYHGRGAMTYPNGEEYVGEWKDEKKNGQGVLTNTSGEKYVGEWRDGEIIGQGTYSYPDGATYIGELIDGKKNGQGTFTFPTGEKYVGEFRDDKRHGQGTFTFPNNIKYVGEWSDGEYHGLGVIYEPDGSIKKAGQWEKNKFIRAAPIPGLDTTQPKQAIAAAKPAPQVQPAPESKALPPCPSTPSETWTDCTGTMTLPNGRTYVGEWKDGKRHGQGVSTVPSGDKYVGEFRNDEKSGQGTYTFANGQTYIGEWKNDQMNGQGTATFLEGQVYVGEWKDRKRHGLGTLTFKEGAKYVGQWRDDARNGLGIEYWYGKGKKEGVWENDKFIRAATVPHHLLPQSKQVSAQPVLPAATEIKPPQPQNQPVTLPDSGRRVALVIGNTHYQNSPQLPNAENDADLMAATLRNVGFQSVIVKKDLTQPQMLQALREFSALAENADWALVHYSGHGLEFGGVNYIVPIEARLRSDRDIDLEAIDVGKVLSALEGAKRLRLVILDACRDNPLASQMKRSLASRSLGRGLARVEPETGTLIAYAAKHGETALDGTGKNSPFVEALVKRLQQKPPLEVRRLFDVVRDDVMRSTNKKQQPFSYGSVSGEQDFYFAGN